MTGRRIIQRLDDRLINQIAAGEVIERPASLLKELLENSLDAGADSIEIQVERGGVKRIQVADNGTGIERDELALALSRHATSKISRFEDLYQIQSLGFRGEALPSIAAVSKLRLSSRTREADSAFELRCHGGQMLDEPAPRARETGTTIEVTDLFYNTPVRRKFLRTEATEFRHIDQGIRKLALSRFDVGFRLLHNGKLSIDCPPVEEEAARGNRIARICGDEFAQNSVHFSSGQPDMQLQGWLGLPTFSRSQRDLQYFYVNGRAIRDPLVAHAVKRAYADVIYSDRHPAFVLYMNLAPEAVDVNVHPAKTEVRFKDTRQVHDFIYRTLKQVIADLRPGDNIPPARANVPSSLARSDSTVSMQNPASGYAQPRSAGYASYPSTGGRGAGQAAFRFDAGEQMKAYRATHGGGHGHAEESHSAETDSHTDEHAESEAADHSSE